MAPTDPNKSLPIFPLLSMFGKTNGILEVTSKLFFSGGFFGSLLNNKFRPSPGGGGSGGIPLSIKSSIVGSEGGG